VKTQRYNNGAVIHGNCFDLLPKRKHGSVDLIISDPFFEDLTPEYIDNINKLYHSLLKPTGVLIWFAKQPHTPVIQVQTEKRLKFVNEYIWHFTDTTCFRAMHMPLIHHQNILVFVKDEFTGINMEEMREPVRRPAEERRFKTTKVRGKETGQRRYWEPNEAGSWRSSVIQVQKSHKGLLLKEKTPVGVKPFELFDILIRGYSKKGGLVLDPFFGSGTTGAVCGSLGRKFLGIEIEEKWFELSVKRLNLTIAQGGKINKRL